MNRKFSPLRIQRPSSIQQVARVLPGQEIILELDETYGKLTVDVSSELMKVEKLAQWTFRITHTSQIHDWADYSSTMIGEIWVDGDKIIAKISVILISQNINKTKIITVINPDCYDLRIYANNVIEVIGYDLRFGFNDEWTYEWVPTKDIGIEQIGQDHLCLSSWSSYDVSDKPDYLYARYPRTNHTVQEMMTRQHHMWFRLNFKAFGLISKENDVVHIGDLSIIGKSNRYQFQNAYVVNHHMSVFVDCRKKCYQQIQDTMNVGYKNDFVPGSCGPKTPVVVVPPARQIKDVDVFLQENDFLGCKVLDAIDDVVPYPNKHYDQSGYYDREYDRQYDIDIDDFDHFPMHNHPRRPGFLRDCWR